MQLIETGFGFSRFSVGNYFFHSNRCSVEKMKKILSKKDCMYHNVIVIYITKVNEAK